MASATAISFSERLRADYTVSESSKEAASVASRVLQENHDKHDIIFTDVGLQSKSISP